LAVAPQGGYFANPRESRIWYNTRRSVEGGIGWRGDAAAGEEAGGGKDSSRMEPIMQANARPQPIERPRFDEDVVPLSVYRQTLDDCFARTARTHRPIVITQGGRATNVLISIADFESTWNEIERFREREDLTRDVLVSRRQFDEGKFVTEDEAFDEMETMLDSMQSHGECK
jgi:prevent-host-death family protein